MRTLPVLFALAVYYFWFYCQYEGENYRFLIHFLLTLEMLILTFDISSSSDSSGEDARKISETS